MPTLIFQRQKLTDFFDSRSKYLVEYLKDYTETEISNFNETDIKFLLDKCTIDLPVFTLGDVKIEQASAYSDAQKTQAKTSFDQNYELGDSRAINNFLFFRVPYSGDESVFYLSPYPDFSGVVGVDSLSSSELVFRYILDPFQPVETQIQNHIPQLKSTLRNIQAVLEKLKIDIETFNQNLKDQLLSEINRRKYVSNQRTAVKLEQPKQIQPTTKIKSLGTLDLGE